MPSRMAACLALIAFAVCLVVGGLEAGNTFATTVSRALAAMAVTYVVGLIVGVMGERMLDDNLKEVEKKLENSEVKPPQSDR